MSTEEASLEMLDTLDERKPTPWTLGDAVELCRLVEAIVSKEADSHVALTGGCLYKDGQRKDCDLLFYSIRQSSGVEDTKPKVLKTLTTIDGLFLGRDYGWCVKALYQGRSVDLFFPEMPLSGDDNY